MGSNCQDNAWVVIAAFNEGSVIANTVESVLPYVGNVVVCDDCSADGTAEAALAAGAHVLSHPINLGQGAALQTGIEYALRQQADYIVTFDADGQHDAREILPMLAALKASGVDAVLGSRFLGTKTHVPFPRKLVLASALLCTTAFAR